MTPLRIVTALLAVHLLVAAESPAEDKPRKQILITNVRIFNGKDAALLNGHVLVEGNLIKAVSAERPATRDDATIVDGGGGVLTPGFIDAHTHIALIDSFDKLENEHSGVYVGAAGGQMAENMLMRGFTTVRDAGGASIGIQRAIDDGWFKGPRVYSSGAFLTQTSGHLDMHDRNEPHRRVGGSPSRAELIGHFVTADGKAEILAAVRENFRQGATQIKLATNGGVSAVYSPLDIDQFTSEELDAAVEAATSFGSYVMVHAYYDRACRRAIEAGAKSIEHGHFMKEETIKLMAEKGVFLVVEALMSTSPSPKSFSVVQRAKYELVKSQFTQMIAAAKKHRVKIAFGSDVFLSKEAYDLQSMEWIARSNVFTPLENLRQATSLGAELISYSGPRNRYKDGPLGVIQPGAYADIIIVKGNPLEDIKILANPGKNLGLIMKNGVIYKNTMAAK